MFCVARRKASLFSVGRPFRGAATIAAACVIACAVAPLVGQSGAANGEWRSYGGDLGHTRYSPLDQINATNFGKLEVAWRFKTDSLGPRPEYQFESTPLMIKGVLYSTAGSRRAVVALDAGTGELLWMHSENEGARGAAAPRQLSGRGLAYWSDGREERILYVTPGYRLIALDAKTGAPVATFGKNGVVDLKLDDDQAMDLITGEIGLHSTPTVAKDVVIVGAAHRTGANPKSRRNEKGYVRGFDVRTGKRLWIFHTIPQAGEFGNDTWEKDSWAYTGNTGVWAQISVDEELGLVYLPVEMPTGDYYGGHRPGNGLFGESLVAVDLQTGKRRWHYQLVHHGIWDHDIPCAAILVNITVNGRAIKAVAQPTKQGWLYVFNRETGEPIWPIEERPVAKGDVPGEWYAPTQPFPTKPPAYERQGVSVDDLIDFTPELRAEALKVVQRYRIGPIFTPPVVSKIDGPLATMTAGFATNWPGGSYDPETHIAYIYSQSSASPLGVVPPPDNMSDMNFRTHRRDAWRGRARGRRGRRRPDRPGPSVAEAAVLPHQRDRLEQGRYLVADRQRRHPGQRPEPPGAERPDHSADRPLGPDRPARDQDAADRRRGRCLHDAFGTTRRDAARLRQGERQRGRRRLHARAGERVTHDLHAQRQAVHRHRS